MDECQTSSIISWYEELEERLIEFLKFFPFTPQNSSVSSPRLAGVVSETCNILDSLFREVFPVTITRQQVIVCKNCKAQRKKQNLDIRDYAAYYARLLNLPDTKSLMFVSPPIYLTPFKEWSSITVGGSYTPLPWWNAYTKLKHNRIRNIEKATLTNALNALCGLHQVIAKLPQLAPATVRREWFPIHGISFGGNYYTTNVGELLTNYSQKCESYLVESKLFIVPAGKRIFPGNTPTDLDPDIYHRGPRLSSFLGRGW